MRFLRSRSGQKKRCGGHGSLPICRDTGLETNCAVAAVQSGASPADILAPLAQSGGDGASGGTGRKLDLPFGAHMEL